MNIILFDLLFVDRGEKIEEESTKLL